MLLIHRSGSVHVHYKSGSTLQLCRSVYVVVEVERRTKKACRGLLSLSPLQGVTTNDDVEERACKCDRGREERTGRGFFFARGLSNKFSFQNKKPQQQQQPSQPTKKNTKSKVKKIEKKK